MHVLLLPSSSVVKCNSSWVTCVFLGIEILMADYQRRLSLILLPLLSPIATISRDQSQELPTAQLLWICNDSDVPATNAVTNNVSAFSLPFFSNYALEICKTNVYSVAFLSWTIFIILSRDSVFKRVH